MGEPLKMLGAQSKVAAWYIAIDFTAGSAKSLIYDFESNPPTTEDEYLIFFKALFRLLKELDYIKLTAQQGLEVAKANGIISQTTDPAAALREIIDDLEEILERMEEQ